MSVCMKYAGSLVLWLCCIGLILPAAVSAQQQPSSPSVSNATSPAPAAFDFNVNDYIPEIITDALQGNELCTQLDDSRILQKIDTRAIRAACGDSRDISWNPCGTCLCALTGELSKIGLNTTYSLELYSCADKLRDVLVGSGLSTDDAVYMLSACPAKCRVSDWKGRCPRSRECTFNKPLYPQAFKLPPEYLNNRDYCNRHLAFQASYITDDKFMKSTPLTGNRPTGCVTGCIMGMNLQDIYARTFNWDGKCFFPGSQLFNYNEPGRNIVLEGATSSGVSWFDDEPTTFIEYSDSLWWRFWTTLATLGQIGDYTIYHDEIREDPTQPGLFHGLTYIRPFNFVNPSPLRVIGIRFALLQTTEGLVEDTIIRAVNDAIGIQQ